MSPGSFAYTIRNGLVILGLICFYCTTSYSQRDDMDFGNLPKKYLTMENYERDTSANAVVLGDYGEVEFSYRQEEGFIIHFKRHVRIKIFNKEGYKWANAGFRLYRKGGEIERKGAIRGYTYNLENGKVKRKRLRNKAEYQEELDENNIIQKFTMPNVKAGSVIEYKYSILSDYVFNLRTWNFQREIPVIYSQFKARIPEYFTYNPIYRGFHKINYGEKGYQDNIASVWFAKHLPAIKDEPHVPNYRDYTTRIKFELKSVNFPNQSIQKVTSSWQQVNEKLLDHDRFGDQLSIGNFLEDKVLDLTSAEDSASGKMMAIFSYVKANYKWNNENGLLTSTRLRKVFKEKEGNAADINLLLTRMLQEAGINASPVILSTRRHGLVYPVFPSITQFNYVVSGVQTGEDFLFLDATQPMNTINLLPPRCLNDSGRVIDERNGRWVSLLKDQKSEEVISAQLSFDEQLKFKGSIQHIYKNLAARNLVTTIQKAGGISAFEDNFKEKHSELMVDSLQPYNIKQTNIGVFSIEREYFVELSDYFQNAGNRIYFDPLLAFKMEENPYQLKERKLPVDRPYPRKKTYMLKLKIPENYQLADKPDRKIISFPDNEGVFSYSVSQMGNQIMVVSRYNVKKTFFQPYEYQGVKKFHDEVVKKHSEKLVLEKKPGKSQPTTEK